MLPISVIIPHQPHRAWFFDRYCLPSVRACNPQEIIVEAGPGGAPEKRNSGYAKATQPYVFFCDDDAVLGGDCLGTMLAALGGNGGAAYAYSDYAVVPWPGIGFAPPAHMVCGCPFDLTALRHGNYINTLSLLRHSAFPGFDPALRRYQDWDLWLTLAGRGHYGVYVPGVLYMLFTIDRGITLSVPAQEALWDIKRKHGLK